jgi:hypothetical protein
MVQPDAHAVTPSKKHPTYLIRLRSQRGENIHGLRRLLKALLRHGWRCISIEEVRS